MVGLSLSAKNERDRVLVSVKETDVHCETSTYLITKTGWEKEKGIQLFSTQKEAIEYLKVTLNREMNNHTRAAKALEQRLKEISDIK